MASRINLFDIALEKAFCKPFLSEVSDTFKRVNFANADEVENLQASIIGRLTSGFNVTVLNDVLTLLDVHTVLNIPSLDNEVQNKIMMLFQRYFKLKHEQQAEDNEFTRLCD